MKSVSRTMGLAFTCAALALPKLAFATASILFSTNGAGASADFSSVDGSGCVTTTVHVEVGSQEVKNPPINSGGPAVGGFVLLSIEDACTGAAQEYEGFSTDWSLQLDRQLTAATAQGSVGLCDAGEPATCFTVSVNIAWTGAGDVVKTQGASQSRSGGFVMVQQAVQDVRSATAAGSISDGTTNFTPVATSGGSLEWSQFHDVIATRAR